MPPTRRDFLQGTLATSALTRFNPKMSMLSSSSKDRLWYKRPAERWLEALPIGNGRLGGMVFGGVQTERVALSESTAWSGAPAQDEVNPGAREHLPEIRSLFFAGKYDEAQDLCAKYLPGHAKNFGTNLPLSDLLIDFEEPPTQGEYKRWLDLENAITHVDYFADGIHFQREVFSSHADGILVVHLTSSAPRAITFQLHFSPGILPHSVSIVGEDCLVQKGHCFEKMHSSGRDGVAFEVRAKVQTDGKVSNGADRLHVRDATNVTILLAIGTSFGGADPSSFCERILSNASRRTYTSLRQRHLADYQPLYRRMSISLGETNPKLAALPTDERRKEIKKGDEDPELLALFFQYGRYLTIAGSRQDSPLPLALQGIWNDGLASSMGWTDDFHLDINTQQNYWAAEVCNLSECQTPLFRLIEVIRGAGRATARDMYGAPGWVVHTVTNPWGFTAPGSPGWGVFVTAGIWICQQIWDRYNFGGDIGFLREHAYPVLKEAAEFFLAYMVQEPEHGWLVTGPSDSPENWYIAPSGHHLAESMGNTVDRVFVNALYSMCIESARALKIDQDFRALLEVARDRLPPFQIGRHGQLQEWLHDFEDAEPNHRHTAHLVALYPEDQISPRRTPQLARAAEITIQRRMNAPHWEQSEWGRANLVVYYSRLLKGELALEALAGLLGKAADDNLLTYSSGGVAGAESNIFALDGNTAGAAGIAEMLLQSQSGEIELLPALPSAWKTGYVHGLCARGGYVVDVIWHEGRFSHAIIRGDKRGKISVRYGDSVIEVDMEPSVPTRLSSSSFRKGDIAK